MSLACVWAGGVEVFDRDRVWTAPGGRRGPFPSGEPAPLLGGSHAVPGMPGYGHPAPPSSLPPHPHPPPQQPLSEHDVGVTVLQREAARVHKNYALADQLRDSLRAAGVNARQTPRR